MSKGGARSKCVDRLKCKESKEQAWLQGRGIISRTNFAAMNGRGRLRGARPSMAARRVQLEGKGNEERANTIESF